MTTRPGPLVSADWLEEHLDDPDVVVLEVSSSPPEEATGFERHIPGSRYVFWKDLCWDDTDRQFPSPEVMADRLGALGVGADTFAVLAGDPIQFATYPYWVAAMAGLEDRVTVLDGGSRTWLAEGRPSTDADPGPPTPRELTPGPAQDSMRIGRDDVLAGLGTAGRVLVDLRSDAEYEGRRVSPDWYPVDYGAERKGRIPGAVHLYYKDLLDDGEHFRPTDDIEAAFASVGASRDQDVVTYCRLSHRASLGWFALTRLSDRSDVRVYDGSWTEWGSIVGFPIER
jgi:thiosulfate/3-mercaptopyruvate sulfurtransferase